MITDKDIEKLKSVFATKDDLEKHEIRTGESFIEVTNKIDNLENRFDGLENRFDSLENRFDGLENRFDNLENQFKDLKNEVLNMEDHIIQELKSMQLEQQVSLSHKRELANHEKRIIKIENRLAIT